MQSDDHRPGPVAWLCLSAIIVLAGGLRLYHLTASAISGDELCSIESADGHAVVHAPLPRNVILSPPPNLTHLSGAAPIWTVADAMHHDVHPPLYFLLLRIVEDLFGDGPAALRAISVLAGVVSVILIFDVGRWLGGIPTGLWAALLMAVAQPQIVRSQDARPYALSITFALAAADALVRLEYLGISRGRLFALAAGLAAASLTHYFTLGASLAMGAYSLIRFRGRARRDVILAFVGAAAVVLIVWGHGMWMQRRIFFDPGYYWYEDNSPGHAAAAIERFASLPIRYLAEPLQNASTVHVAEGAAVLYLLPWLLCRRRPQMILLGLWLIGCAGLVSAMDFLRATQMAVWIKYTLVGAPAVYLMLPMLSHRRVLNNIVAASAVIFCLVNLAQAYDVMNADYRLLAREIDRAAAPGDLLLIDGEEFGDWWYTDALYLGVQRYSSKLPGSVALLESPISPEFQAELAGRTAGHHCFMVYWLRWTPERMLPGWRMAHVVHFVFPATFCELIPPSEAQN